jgi:hypothetical protein
MIGADEADTSHSRREPWAQTKGRVVSCRATVFAEIRWLLAIGLFLFVALCAVREFAGVSTFAFSSLSGDSRVWRLSLARVRVLLGPHRCDCDSTVVLMLARKRAPTCRFVGEVRRTSANLTKRRTRSERHGHEGMDDLRVVVRFLRSDDPNELRAGTRRSSSHRTWSNEPGSRRRALVSEATIKSTSAGSSASATEPQLSSSPMTNDSSSTRPDNQRFRKPLV